MIYEAINKSCLSKVKEIFFYEKFFFKINVIREIST